MQQNDFVQPMCRPKSINLLVQDASQGVKMRRNQTNSASHRVKLWPWTGSEIRLTAFLKTHKRCSYAQSKLFALTALGLSAVIWHQELKV